MHFVHIEDFFHPNAGYQVNLLTKIQVEQGNEVTIVTSELNKIPTYLTSFFGKDNIEEKDNEFTRRTGVRIVRLPLVGFYSGRSIYYPNIFKIVDNLKPDVLFVHGEDTLIGMQYIWRYKKLKYPLVLDCHMLEMASENKFKYLFRKIFQRFFAPIIINNEIPLIRVTDSDYVEKCLGIPLSKTILLSFGTDTNFFFPNLSNKIAFREKYDISSDSFVVLYAGKLDIYKGGKFFADSILDKFNSTKQIVFIIIGNTDGEFGANVESTFSKSQNRILRFPTQTYSDLAEFYQAADIAVFPKQCSMSFFEVQACGLPVLFEENEINSQRAMFNNAITFKSGDINDFRNLIMKFADMPNNDFTEMAKCSRKYVLDNYDYLPIAKRFTEIMIKEKKQFDLK
jgi:glycosyltransferase involved in cell wall biosynthesis